MLSTFTQEMYNIKHDWTMISLRQIVFLQNFHYLMKVFIKFIVKLSLLLENRRAKVKCCTIRAPPYLAFAYQHSAITYVCTYISTFPSVIVHLILAHSGN